MVNLTLRSWRLLLKLTCAIAAGSIAAIILTALLLPLEVKVPEPQQREQHDSDIPLTAVAQPRPLETYAVIYQSKMLQTLIDPQPAAPPPPPPPPPRPAVVLEGTAIEPGFTMALLRTARGQAQWVGIGQTMEDIEVLEIHKDEVLVRHRGRNVTIKSISSARGRP